jgi:hypothetical protein
MFEIDRACHEMFEIDRAWHEMFEIDRACHEMFEIDRAWHKCSRSIGLGMRIFNVELWDIAYKLNNSIIG